MSQLNYIQELVEEIEILDPSRSMYTIQLLEEEINRVRTKAKKKEKKEKRKKEEIVKLVEKIVVPVDEYPGHNFIGKLMGPKASTLKRIQSVTKSSILILGKGSTRDKVKEKMLSESNDPKYAHYKEPLHVVIYVKGFKSEAEERLAAAVAEVKKYMDPNNEEVKQESLRTLALLVTPNSYNVNGIAPIIRVGVPPPGAITLSGKIMEGDRSSSSVANSDPYVYDAKYDGTYEGYPSTADSLAFEYIDSNTRASKRTISYDVYPDPDSVSDTVKKAKEDNPSETEYNL